MAKKKTNKGKKIPAQQGTANEPKGPPQKYMTSENGSGDPVTTPKEDNADPALVKMADALGTTDRDLQNHLLSQVILAFPGCATQDGIDHENLPNCSIKAMAILEGIQPRDEIEGMLAVQMTGVHNMAMETLKLAMLGGQTFAGKDANVNRATKMLRTFIAQVEALKRYRTGGQQKMIVEHVHVNEGGQAVVGTINQGGGK